MTLRLRVQRILQLTMFPSGTARYSIDL